MRLFAKGQFPKLAFLPELPFAVWFWLWAIAITLTLGHAFGWWLDWWSFHHDLNHACMLVFWLLAFTPTMARPSVFFLVRLKDADDPDDWVPLRRRKAMELCQEDAYIVRRIVVLKGEIVEDQQLVPREQLK